MKKLDYKIIGSGSKGNAVRIEDIMIDCGVAYKDMKAELNKCKLLFITHIHSDHLNKRTMKQIKRHHRTLKIVGNWQVAQHTEVDIISNIKPIESKTWTITPFEVPHDVLCQGIVIELKKYDISIIYVTDSAGHKDWKQGKYDYLFIESNHDENKLKMLDVKKYGYDVISGAKRHTSYQESKAFYYMNRKSKDSEWIELHKSERFY